MFVRPEEIVKSFDLHPGMTVADFGCGAGHYSIAMAKIVQKEGSVYAIDIQKELLAALKTTAEMNTLENLHIVWADLEQENGSHLADGIVDFGIISNILFQVEERNKVVKEIFRVLKNRGRVVVVEWAAPSTSSGQVGTSSSGGGAFGPPATQRISKQDAQTLFLQQGFKFLKEIQPGDNHYGMIFVKP